MIQLNIERLEKASSVKRSHFFLLASPLFPITLNKTANCYFYTSAFAQIKQTTHTGYLVSFSGAGIQPDQLFHFMSSLYAKIS